MSSFRSPRSGSKASQRPGSPASRRGGRPTGKRPLSNSRMAKEPSYGSAIEVTVNSLGAKGDGVSVWNDETLFVPFTLPGERVLASPGPKRGDGISARLETILAAAPERATPPCPAFQTCGGCTLQHLGRANELSWKRDLVVTALNHRGFDDADRVVGDPIAIPAATRRRMSLSYRRLRDRMVVGFNARASHQIVSLNQCPLLADSLNGFLAACATALAPAVPLAAQGDLVVAETETGLDVVLDLPDQPDLDGYQALAEAAERLDLARLSLRINGITEPLALRRQPSISFDGITIPLPAGAFLQPSKDGERALQDLVRQGLADISGPVADLFCGVGTFALTLAAQGRAVHAYDHLAMQTAPLHSTGRVIAQQRDLYRLPLLPEEMGSFTAMVLDPPRAGAKEQVEEICRTDPHGPLRRVVMVSCNPATFARDARILVDGGFTLRKVTPVDQFIWSAHLEVVAIFERLS